MWPPSDRAVSTHATRSMDCRGPRRAFSRNTTVLIAAPVPRHVGRGSWPGVSYRDAGLVPKGDIHWRDQYVRQGRTAAEPVLNNGKPQSTAGVLGFSLPRAKSGHAIIIQSPRRHGLAAMQARRHRALWRS